MKNLIYLFSFAFLLFSCEEDSTPEIETESIHDLRVALYSQPDVFIETMNHSGEMEEVKLNYNRQVYVNFDESTTEQNADTTGYHWNDANYIKFDLWTPSMDESTEAPGWDIVFSYYNGKLQAGGQEMPYYVTGALLNKGNVEVLKLNKTDMIEAGQTFVNYTDMTLDQALNYTYSTAVDAIGHDWKAFDMSSFSYTIVQDQYYVIKTDQGVLYKLEFLDFYSEDGALLGFPKFRFEKLFE